VTYYYDDGSIRITSDALHVDGRAYPLRVLRRVWHQRGRRSWRRVAGRGALGAALLLPVAAALLGLLLALRIDASGAVTVALVGGACLAGFAAVPVADVLLEHMDRSYARGTRDLQVWAEVQHRAVLLLRTDDAQRFGQIYRALQRALERPVTARRAAISPAAARLSPAAARLSPVADRPAPGRVARRNTAPVQWPTGR
jgi:Family of unknown function (DUF6232)